MPSSRPLIKLVIDWIAFRLTLPSTSNFMFVRRVFEGAGYLHGVHVLPHMPGPGGAATAFDVKLQDPKQVRRLSDFIEAQWPGATTALTGLEVAMDTYKPGADQIELGDIVAARLRWMEYPSTGMWHLYKKRGMGAKSLDRHGHDAFTGDADGSGMSQARLAAFLGIGWQLADHVPWTNPPVRFRLQVKRTDRAGKVHLPRGLWRARFEVTLDSSMMPWADLREVASADFTVLSGFFRFRKPAMGLPPALDLAIRAADYAGWQPARRGAYRRPSTPSKTRRPGNPLIYRAFTSADSRLNRMVHDRLRNLGGRLRR